MFITLFSRRFTSGETQATKRKFKIPLLFILDEFDKLGRMDELEMNMGIHNGFGIHYFLIFQSLNQLNKIYTKDHSFLAHCRNSIFFAPGAGEYEEAELISKICGKESFSKANISYSSGRGGLGYNNASLSSQDQERNLINPDEVMKLPLDRFVLLVQGMPPYIGKKNVYYDDPVFRKRMTKEAAFSTREEAEAMAKETVKKLKSNRWFLLASELAKEGEEPETRDNTGEGLDLSGISQERMAEFMAMLDDEPPAESKGKSAESAPLPEPEADEDFPEEENWLSGADEAKAEAEA
jgi:type IV secretory pathway TraG/TraD family ATPase VirD4